MSLTTWPRRLPFFSPSHSRSPSPRRTSWADDTFISSDEAETALCNDRSSFVVRGDIMTLVPGQIKKLMNNYESTAHIFGFRELFIHLNNNQSSMPLRQMIEDYFNESPSLRGNLSQSSQVR